MGNTPILSGLPAGILPEQAPQPAGFNGAQGNTYSGANNGPIPP